MHDLGLEGNSRTPKSETPHSPTRSIPLPKKKLGALEVLKYPEMIFELPTK